ncbi:DUF5362 domain-containing protein [Pseudoleptotrichia goodfellowii]|uniref:Uncharacterized protein n=1 Tax=Pseudoleptotrichia goodfellowii F0264 TaxID=596323 RepID=D0GN40_9FUSO|nr:DUF5362 domain-containing protein [Pseudoleptotrichia goodfellowii]EEY34495.1 hypothetical protein HMPREF0554_0006 [Pseudoleptotrichia goodfellowii F0264]
MNTEISNEEITELSEYSSNGYENEPNNSNEISFELDDLTVKNINSISLILKIWGVLNIIIGIMECLTIIKIISGILKIIAAFSLFEVAKFLKQSLYSKDERNIKGYFNAASKVLVLTVIIFILEAAFSIFRIITHLI